MKRSTKAFQTSRRFALRGVASIGALGVISSVGCVAAAEQSAFGRVRRILNVRDFGALGDGSTDCSEALNRAAREMRDGERLFVPAGTYLVDSAAWVIRGKKDIEIVGEGESTKVIVSDPSDANSQKQDFHSTMVVDGCANILISSMNIESRGANYGNTDAYGRLPGGDQRAAAITNAGGSALAVLRCREVRLEEIVARRCGSVGVIYLSSCESVSVRRCFANARSLGYAGFAVDNWVESSLNVNRVYNFEDCAVAREDAKYSSKGGIVAEGDNGIPLSLTISGGSFSDAATGGNAPTYGTGITILDSNVRISGTHIQNCYVGIHLQKRGGVSNPVTWSVSDCSILENRVTGIYLAIGRNNTSGFVKLERLKIETAERSVWSAVANSAVSASSGIVHDGYMAGEVEISDASISGPQFGIYSTDQATFHVSGGKIAAIEGGVSLYGAGSNELVGIDIRTSGPTGVPVFVSTLNRAGSASRFATSIIHDCRLDAVGGGDAVRLTGNSKLFSRTEIKSNVIVRGAISAPRGAASTYEVD